MDLRFRLVLLKTGKKNDDDINDREDYNYVSRWYLVRVLQKISWKGLEWSAKKLAG